MDKFVNLGAAGMACLHLFCCGIPLLAAIFGAASPFSSVVSHEVAGLLLIAAGLLLGMSWYRHFSGCKCDRKLLFIATGLFTLSFMIYFLTH